MSASSCGAPRFSISSESMWCRLTRHSLAMPPWISASLRLLYDSTSSTYLPTMPIVDLGLRALEPVDDALPAGQLGRARPDVEQLADLVVEALARGSGSAARRCSSTSSAENTASAATLENSAIFFFSAGSSGRSRAAEQDVGLDADLAQLLHRVLGRLGLELAGGGDVRHQREVHARRRSACRPRGAAGGSPRGTAATRCRRPCRRPRRSARRGPWRSSRMRALISSVMCGITWTVPPRYSPRRSFWITVW